MVEVVLVVGAGVEGSMTILRRVAWRACWDMVGVRGVEYMVPGSLVCGRCARGCELAGLLFVGI